MDPQEDILSEFNEELNAQPVGTAIRFADYTIDFIIFYFILLIIIELMSHDSPGIAQGHGFLTIIGYIVYLFYYTILEGVTGGRTPGKMITGCRAIKNDGSNLTWNEAFLRSLGRIVPFEAFSAFGGNPWHDLWTHTKVVKNKRANSLG